MKQYIGTKVLKATPMTRGDYNSYRSWFMPSDENPNDEGYLVEYLDGGKSNHPKHTNYISWSPKDVFEKSYRPNEGMSFGQAIEAMRHGVKVSRAGWNGKGMSVQYIDSGSWDLNRVTAVEFTLLPFFAIQTVDHKLVPWVPSINDCLAEDWSIVQ